MKVGVAKGAKNFSPIELNVTIESEAELIDWYLRMNKSHAAVMNNQNIFPEEITDTLSSNTSYPLLAELERLVTLSKLK